MQNWIAKDKNHYFNKAEYFSNKKFLNELKRKLIIDAKKSTLFNSRAFANEFGKMIMSIL